MAKRILCVTVIMLVAAAARAQESVVGPGVDTKALSTVYVLDDRGAETKGTLLRLDEQSVLVLVNGQERRFDLGSVVKIDKRGDSLKNGAITGAVIGAIIGGLTSGIADCSDGDGGYSVCGVGARIGLTLVGAAVYGAIGTGIDAAIAGRMTLYRKPTITSASGRHARGASVRFTVRW
jgi:hypothetical protein